jgi:micrococcal nuclease
MLLKSPLRSLSAAGLAATIGASLLAPEPTVRADPVATTAVVLKVVDGDTVDIRDDVRGRLRIRLLGSDTPETHKPGYTVGCWGPEASEFAKETLLGQRVAFATDPSQGMHDRYGRTLAYLDKADGWDYLVEAARAGVAIPTSITAIPRPEPTKLQLPNRKRRPLAGACGDRRASAKRRQPQSDSPRCLRPTVRPRGRALSRRAVPPGRGCRRAGVHRVAGGGGIYGWGDPGG